MYADACVRLYLRKTSSNCTTYGSWRGHEKLVSRISLHMFKVSAGAMGGDGGLEGTQRSQIHRLVERGD